MLTLNLHTARPESTPQLPTFGSRDAACFDVRACLNGIQYVEGFNADNLHTKVQVEDDAIVIWHHLRLLIPTGWKFDIPQHHSIRLHPRSGLALKQGLVLANAEGVIDSDYVNEVFVCIHNTTKDTVKIKDGDRICQGELVKHDYHYDNLNFGIVFEDIEQKTNRDGGFGSTGTK